MTIGQIPVQTGYVPVNDLQMYYEIHGEGQPLVLLHGAFSAIGTSFEQLLPGLAEGRQVVAFELQGHGRTADIDRPLTLEALADDVAAAIDQLSLGRADIFGYSTGAQARARLSHLQHGRRPSRSDGGIGRDDARDDARLALARRVPAHRAASRRLPEAVRQKDSDGSADQRPFGRGDERDQSADLVDHRRF